MRFCFILSRETGRMYEFRLLGTRKSRRFNIQRIQAGETVRPRRKRCIFVAFLPVGLIMIFVAP